MKKAAEPGGNTQLIKLDDLIGMALGPHNQNVVNFKMIQMILHILARQMRLLNQMVEIHGSEAAPRADSSLESSLDLSAGPAKVEEREQGQRMSKSGRTKTEVDIKRYTKTLIERVHESKAEDHDAEMETSKDRDKGDKRRNNEQSEFESSTDSPVVLDRIDKTDRGGELERREKETWIKRGKANKSEKRRDKDKYKHEMAKEEEHLREYRRVKGDRDTDMEENIKGHKYPREDKTGITSSLKSYRDLKEHRLEADSQLYFGYEGSEATDEYSTLDKCKTTTAKIEKGDAQGKFVKDKKTKHTHDESALGKKKTDTGKEEHKTRSGRKEDQIKHEKGRTQDNATTGRGGKDIKEKRSEKNQQYETTWLRSIPEREDADSQLLFSYHESRQPLQAMDGRGELLHESVTGDAGEEAGEREKGKESPHGKGRKEKDGRRVQRDKEVDETIIYQEEQYKKGTEGKMKEDKDENHDHKNKKDPRDKDGGGKKGKDKTVEESGKQDVEKDIHAAYEGGRETVKDRTAEKGERYKGTKKETQRDHGPKEKEGGGEKDASFRKDVKYGKQRNDDRTDIDEKNIREEDRVIRSESGLLDASVREYHFDVTPKGSNLLIKPGSTISIKEAKRGKDNVLVAQRIPAPSRSKNQRIGGIEVVTRSQFKMLADAVEALKEMMTPPHLMPDHQTLRSELATGSKSLADAMTAMQLAARVQAVEQGIRRLTELLTELAAQGQLQEVQGEGVGILGEDTLGSSEPETLTPLLVISEPKDDDHQGTSTSPPRALASPDASERIRVDKTRASTFTSASRAAHACGVTHPEMEEALRKMFAELMKFMQERSARAAAAADTALAASKAVEEKMETAEQLDARLTTLCAVVADYAEQLAGFDAGIASQLQGFEEQMEQMRGDLAQGLALVDACNNNSETAAVLELREAYSGVMFEMECAMDRHRGLVAFQHHLYGEIKGLVDVIETMKDQKVDRDEYLDGLRDKADSSRLEGLLTEQEFRETRDQLLTRIAYCYDKFNRQEATWQTVVGDFSGVMEGKAEVSDLLEMRESAQRQLRDLQHQVELMMRLLGEPKAALLARKLARDATCAACREPATMAPAAAPRGPPELPPGGPRVDPDLACLQESVRRRARLHGLEEGRRHFCHRWCGGSHTRVADHVTRERASCPKLPVRNTTRYLDYGNDARLYKLEKECVPCVECNALPPAMPGVPDLCRGSEEGAGDQGVTSVCGGISRHHCTHHWRSSHAAPTDGGCHS